MKLSRRFAHTGSRRVPSIAAGCALPIAALLVGGCVSWKPGWTEAAAVDPAAEDAAPLIARAKALARDADSEEKLVEAIDAYESALERAPGNYEALAEACQWNILHAAAYSERNEQKKRRYKRGIRQCERAMYTNAEFRELVDRGATLDDAVHALSLREADAILFWVTGVSYYFKECLRGVARLTGFRMIARTEKLLARMVELDPDYSDGAVHFSRGIYYLGLPKFAGGDDRKSLELLNRAQEVGPRSMLIPWGRAKYYHVETRNRTAFERDLRWVLGQDPREASTPYAWNVYFQRDAAELLAEADRLF